MKLSIIIPVYNVEKYLAKCLDSVIYPALPGYEIIIVNDGSPDSSPAVAADYAARCPGLIRLITQENGGLGAARNAGLERASGDYVLFLDSDDSLAPNALPEMLSRLDEGFDICMFGVRSVNEHGDEVNSIPVCDRGGVFDLKSYPALLLSTPSACNKLFRRALFSESGVRFPGRVWYEDLRTVPKLYLSAEKIVTDSRRWYIYLQRAGSITSSANAARNLEIIDAVDDLNAYYKARGEFDAYHDELEYCAFYNQFLTASVRVCLAGERGEIQDRLIDDFLAKFPDFENNRYVREARLTHKLLTSLLLRRRYSAVRAIMSANNRIKHKDT